MEENGSSGAEGNSKVRSTLFDSDENISVASSYLRVRWGEFYDAKRTIVQILQLASSE